MINQNKEINYSKIADKETQNLILEKLNTSGGEDNSEVINNINSTTLNTNEKISALDTNLTQVSKSISGDGSTNTGYGTGAMGNITYNASTTVWPTLDAYGRYIWNCTNFTLPEGVTMIPPEKNNGLYIYCTGTCTINGTIDVRKKRLNYNGSNGITHYLIINGNKYNLAKGGNTVKGGDGGKGGEWVTGYTPIEASDKTRAIVAGGKASETVYAGNINGGGTSTYGTGAIGHNNGELFTYSIGFSYTKIPGVPGKTSNYSEPPGAIILCAKTVNIGTNGYLNLEALPGKIATNGTGSQAISTSNTSAGNAKHSGQCGNGGDGAMAPTGGGPVTIITESFTNNGVINNKGGIIECTSNGVQADSYYATGGSSSYFIYCGGGAGGGDGTFISQAGEIKIYIIGG